MRPQGKAEVWLWHISGPELLCLIESNIDLANINQHSIDV